MKVDPAVIAAIASTGGFVLAGLTFLRTRGQYRPVRWALEHLPREKNAAHVVVLRNLGNKTATKVRVTFDHDPVRVMEGAAETVADGASTRVAWLGAYGAENPTRLTVTWAGVHGKRKSWSSGIY